MCATTKQASAINAQEYIETASRKDGISNRARLSGAGMRAIRWHGRGPGARGRASTLDVHVGAHQGAAMSALVLIIAPRIGDSAR